jgi:hypothetical protein
MAEWLDCEIADVSKLWRDSSKCGERWSEFQLECEKDGPLAGGGSCVNYHVAPPLPRFLSYVISASQVLADR